MNASEASVFSVLPYVLGVFTLRGSLYVWVSKEADDPFGIAPRAIATLASPEKPILTGIDPRPIFPREVETLWVQAQAGRQPDRHG